MGGRSGMPGNSGYVVVVCRSTVTIWVQVQVMHAGTSTYRPWSEDSFAQPAEPHRMYSSTPATQIAIRRREWCDTSPRAVSGSKILQIWQGENGSEPVIQDKSELLLGLSRTVIQPAYLYIDAGFYRTRQQIEIVHDTYRLTAICVARNGLPCGESGFKTQGLPP